MIERGLKFVADEGLAWKQDRKCTSCHQIPFMIWSLLDDGSWTLRQGSPATRPPLGGFREIMTLQTLLASAGF